MKKLTVVLLCLFFAPILFAQNLNEDLYQAVLKGDTTIIKELVNKGADANYVKEQGWMKVNMLITAVNKKHEGAVNVLLQKDADVNWKDGFNTTALMYAANSGHIPIVKLLLEHGADASHKDDQGTDALSAARKGKHKQIVKLLEARLKEQK